MKQHVLLGLAARFPEAEPQSHPGWTYDRGIGAWVMDGFPTELMVQKPGPSSPPPPPRPPAPQSKKADRETGEDMKGA